MMSTGKCPDCGGLLSRSARRCPHCGRYIWTTGRIGCAAIILAPIVLGLLGYLFTRLK